MGHATGELKVKATDHSEDDGRSVEWVGYLAVGAQSLKKKEGLLPYLDPSPGCLSILD
jgi:hypothetical protein